MIYSRKASVLSNDINGIFSKTFGNVGGIFNLTFNQLIKSLFAKNEQGFAYDPNDLSTMYQDAAGTVPVTAVGQPVGLMLDKSKGLSLGSELNTTASPKMIGNAPVATYDSTTRVGTVNRVDVVNQSFVTLTGATGGGWYKVSIKNTGSTSISLRNATAFAVDSTLVSINANSNFTGYVYVASNFVLGIAAALGAGTFIIDTVREIAGNHAFQTTSASRPILRQNAVTGANYLEFDGSDDFLQTASINFTATDKVSLFAGVRKLSDAAPGIVCELSTNSFSADGSFYLATPVTTSPPGTDGFNLRGTKAISKTHITISPASVIYTASGDIGGKAIVFRTNGVTRASGLVEVGAGKLGNYPLYIGRRGGTSLPFNGHLYSLIGIGRLTTDIETIALEKSIAKNVGVSL